MARNALAVDRSDFVAQFHNHDPDPKLAPSSTVLKATLELFSTKGAWGQFMLPVFSSSNNLFPSCLQTQLKMCA